MPEETKDKKKAGTKYTEPYVLADGTVDEEEAKFALEGVEEINRWLEARETNTGVFNGMKYSEGYVYNQNKAINHAPARKEGEERNLSMGIPHEKIIGFCSFFLKYVYKRQFSCFDENGESVEGMGTIYDLAVEHSFNLEDFYKKVGLIYWETYTQGDAFVVDEWRVRNIHGKKALKDGKEVDSESMDYTYEYLDGLKYKEGEMIQERKAVSRILDGRQLIVANPEVNNIQDQEGIVIEESMSRSQAFEMYGSLNRWKYVPEEHTDIIDKTTGEKLTLFDASRLKDPKNNVLVHTKLKKDGNIMNVWINGVMMFTRETPMTLWYPRGNYPISQFSAERLTGSAYSRAVPMKVKFTSDYVDWALTQLANKFEQGVDPALLVKGKYTLTKDMFKGGARTHGVTSDAFEKADPENKGITGSEFSFVSMLKEIIESQTLNQTTTGELDAQATATAINASQSGQIEKLGYLLDGVVNGFVDLALRRAETIESRYTIKRKETVVDGKKISVYQQFTVSMGGVEHVVKFDERVGEEGYDSQKENDALFEKAFADKQGGKNKEYHAVNPKAMRKRNYSILCKVVPERRKDSYLKIIEMREEFAWLTQMFGGMLNLDQVKKEYLETSGRSDKLFLPADSQMIKGIMGEEQGAPQYKQGNMSGAGVKQALQTNANKV